ncbi:MAG: hypothetical protein KGD70_03205 [Candidatus Lokiarchaeota archaeon]|jgi:hypothetical protein|nr:hypothetical protein [Candidatus Lokiarchaeota archaeon]
MDNLKTYILQLINFIPLPYYGLLSALVGITGDIIAILLFPNFNLNFMLSDLGTGPGAVYFNIGTFLSGVFALLTYLHIIETLESENINHPKVLRIGKVFAINSCVFFAFIGVVPSVRSNIILFVIHGGIALISLLSGIIYLSCFSYLFFKSENFSRLIGYLPLMTVGFIVPFLFSWHPITEWIMTIGITFWVVTISIYMLYNKM